MATPMTSPALRDALEAIPGNWLDPLLTGPDAILQQGGKWGPPDIERLLNAIRERIRSRANSSDVSVPRVTDEMVERGAKALAAQEYANWDAKDFCETPAGCSPDDMREGYKIAARACLHSALQSGKPSPDTEKGR